MISNASLIACVVSLSISLVLPVIMILCFAGKHKGERLISAWLLGAAGFFVTQILIRIPILSWLQTQSWFQVFSQTHVFLYAFLLAFTAGLFELAGRFAVAKLMRDHLNDSRALTAGMGHGGIEAMLIVGVAYINNLIYMLMIRSGTFDAMVIQVEAAGLDVAQLYALKETFLITPPALYLLAGFERILTMTAHAAMSMIVCYGLHCGKPFRGALVCLGMHTLIDLTAGISMLTDHLPQSTLYFLMYTILSFVALLSVWIIIRIRRRWKETEEQYESASK